MPSRRANAAPTAPDLCACGLIGDLPRRFLDGRERDLLDPLRFVLPGDEDLLEAQHQPRLQRQTLAAALVEANASQGHPAAAELGEALADPTCLVVITGQQCGLGAGPLFTLTKAAACVAWADELTRLGRRAVALFWMASEDHDFAEVARTCFPHASSGPLTLGEDPAPLVPVGNRRLGAEATTLLARVREAAPNDEYRRRLDDCRDDLGADRGFADSFGRLMVRIFGDRCPLLVDSQLPALKAASVPVLRRLIDSRRDVDESLASAAAELTDRAISHPVRSRPGEAPLFVIDDIGERRRVVWTGDDDYRLRGGDGGTVDDLLERAARSPGTLSPGVLARPVVQDAVFGTTLMVLGPGELAYMTQARSLYEPLGVPAPAVALRPQVLLLGARERRWLDRLAAEGLYLADILLPADELERKLAARSDLDFLGRASAKLQAAIDELQTGAASAGPDLNAAWEKTCAGFKRTFGRFERRVVAAAARRDEVLRGRVMRLRAHCLPNGRLQEREVTSLHWLAAYGASLAGKLASMDRDPRRLQPLSFGREPVEPRETADRRPT